MTTDVSETGHRYQLMVRGECGPLTEWLFGDAGDGGTSLIVSARDDSDLYGVLDRIQDLGLHLRRRYSSRPTSNTSDPWTILAGASACSLAS